MKKVLKTGLDFDGVVSDCLTLKSEYARRMLDVRIPPERFKRELVVGSGLLTDTQYSAVQTAIFETREYGLRMEPVPGMLEYVPRLQARGHRLSVVTSREPVSLAVAQEWIYRHELSLELHGVGRGMSKAHACADLDVYLDDDLDKLLPLVGVVPHRFLFSWGYNEHVAEGGVAQRVHSWKQFYEKILALESVR